MPALSETDQSKLLMRVLECPLQTDGWPQVLGFIDETLNCRSFLAEFDGQGAPAARFGGQQPAFDFANMLQQIEMEGGRSALQFLLSEASLFYPYCKTNMTRGRTAGPGGNIDPAGKTTAGTPGRDATAMRPGLEDSLLVAPGLISPIRRTDTSTILFGCLFTGRNPNTIDISVATETFRTIVQALTPGLNICFQLERERRDHAFQRLLLSQVDGPAVLINADRDILAQSGNVMKALARMGAATENGQRLTTSCMKLDTALADLTSAAVPQPPPACAHTQLQRSLVIDEVDSFPQRISISTVYPSRAAPEQTPAPFFVLKVSEAREVPEDLEKWLQDHFDLSQSEAHLARHLTMTGSMSATVSDLRITRNTAKTHLRRIYEKTGVNTQLQLAKLVHRLAQLF
ncbi:helix-turn-helix transcriptional regulator [Roseibium sp. AS2]|uniref:helix-turn-helix transcriptional regulator n=1 Tax=Roseibium sp. AS2 TaxID=3135781 RepID=UPI0031780297